MTDHEAILAIQELMDGVEWNGDTLEAIAEILINAGYKVRDLNDVSLNRSADGED
jgi:hypothetical protein